MSSELAEVQADVLTEALNVNLESLVTKEFLDSRMDARFAEQDARIDTRFAEQDARIDTRFAEQRAYMDSRFAHIEAKLEGKIDSNYRVFVWTQAIVMAAVILPYLERLMAL